jgi:hypothetical protein
LRRPVAEDHERKWPPPVTATLLPAHSWPDRRQSGSISSNVREDAAAAASSSSSSSAAAAAAAASLCEQHSYPLQAQASTAQQRGNAFKSLNSTPFKVQSMRVLIFELLTPTWEFETVFQ